FDFAAKTPCVLFLDEFDAIAKLRGDTQELGELKRVVNSFIQNLDALASHSVILAATNHRELLDSAVWRRFGYRLELNYPDPGAQRTPLQPRSARAPSGGLEGHRLPAFPGGARPTWLSAHPPIVCQSSSSCRSKARSGPCAAAVARSCHSDP